MFQDVSPHKPNHSVHQNIPGLITGQDGPEPNRFSLLLQKIWPPLASTRYKVLLLSGVSLGVAVIVTASVLFALHMHKQTLPKPKTTLPGSTTQQTTGSNDSNNGSTTPDQAASQTKTPDKTTPTTTPKKTTPAPSTGSSGGTSTGGGSTGGGGSTPGGGTTSCALPNYPDASCTGVPAGTTLTAVSGDVHITTAGAVVDGKDIDGCVFVEAPNVTIRNSKITCGFAFGIHALISNYTGGGLLIQDVEVSCNNTSATGVAGYGFTAQRMNIHGCENGFGADNDLTIEDSYIHDFYHNTGAHTDGIQMGGGDNITIRHNRIFNQDTDGTSAIISNETGLSNVLVTNNIMAGGGHTLYCPQTSSVNYRVINNHFSRIYYPNSGFYSPGVYCELAAESTGNVWDDTGLPVPF
jgi:hypothetical protein